MSKKSIVSSPQLLAPLPPGSCSTLSTVLSQYLQPQYSTVLYSTVLYCTVLYCTVQPQYKHHSSAPKEVPSKFKIQPFSPCVPSLQYEVLAPYLLMALTHLLCLIAPKCFHEKGPNAPGPLSALQVGPWSILRLVESLNKNHHSPKPTHTLKMTGSSDSGRQSAVSCGQKKSRVYEKKEGIKRLNSGEHASHDAAPVLSAKPQNQNTAVYSLVWRKLLKVWFGTCSVVLPGCGVFSTLNVDCNDDPPKKGWSLNGMGLKQIITAPLESRCYHSLGWDPSKLGVDATAPSRRKDVTVIQLSECSHPCPRRINVQWVSRDLDLLNLTCMANGETGGSPGNQITSTVCLSANGIDRNGSGGLSPGEARQCPIHCRGAATTYVVVTSDSGCPYTPASCSYSIPTSYQETKQSRNPHHRIILDPDDKTPSPKFLPGAAVNLVPNCCCDPVPSHLLCCGIQPRICSGAAVNLVPNCCCDPFPSHLLCCGIQPRICSGAAVNLVPNCCCDPVPSHLLCCGIQPRICSGAAVNLVPNCCCDPVPSHLLCCGIQPRICSGGCNPDDKTPSPKFLPGAAVNLVPNCCCDPVPSHLLCCGIQPRICSGAAVNLVPNCCCDPVPSHLLCCGIQPRICSGAAVNLVPNCCCDPVPSHLLCCGIQPRICSGAAVNLVPNCCCDPVPSHLLCCGIQPRICSGGCNPDDEPRNQATHLPSAASTFLHSVDKPSLMPQSSSLTLMENDPSIRSLCLLSVLGCEDQPCTLLHSLLSYLQSEDKSHLAAVFPADLECKDKSHILLQHSLDSQVSHSLYCARRLTSAPLRI